MSSPDEIALTAKLCGLERSFKCEQDTIAAWLAMRAISLYNERQVKRRLELYPVPTWLSDYMTRCADKLCRLALGIAPADDRSTLDMGFDEVGRLRRVPQSDGPGATRFRDERASHVAQALGLAGDGWNAFQKHDRLTADAQHLEVWDDPHLQEDPKLQKEVRGSLLGLVKDQESITEEAFKNRLSKARRRQRRPAE